LIMRTAIIETSDGALLAVTESDEYAPGDDTEESEGLARFVNAFLPDELYADETELDTGLELAYDADPFATYVGWLADRVVGKVQEIDDFEPVPSDVVF